MKLTKEQVEQAAKEGKPVILGLPDKTSQPQIGLPKPKKEVVVEWKDTNIYPFAAQYEYPLAIRNRCLFFWTTSLKGWRATIGLANKLTEPNRMCIVYLYGVMKRETLINYVSKLSNPLLIVLWADYLEPEIMQIALDGADTITKAIMKWGWGHESDLDKRNPYLMGEKFDECCYRFAPYRQIPEPVIEGRKVMTQIERDINKRGFINISRNDVSVSAESEKHIQSLFDFVVETYPLGVEANTREDYAYKMVHFEKQCTNGFTGDFSKVNKMGVTYDGDSDETTPGIKEFVRVFHEIADMSLDVLGLVRLQYVLERMKSPPFGLYQCNYYGLCIGIALQKYKNGYKASERLISLASEDVKFPRYVKDYFDVDTGRSRIKVRSLYIYNQTDTQCEFVKKLWSICMPEDEPIPFGITLQNALPHINVWISKHIRYDTVQRFSPELFEILSMRDPNDDIDMRIGPWMLSKMIEKYVAWLTDDMVKYLRQELSVLDEKFLQRTAKEYGEEKTRLYAKSQWTEGGAIGWLWTTDTVDKGVEYYMKKAVICRECGRIIPEGGYELTDYNDFKTGYRKTERLTLQNIINLNKKFLGRYQKEYYCVQCLCEILDLTEWELYDKMMEFKEEGCELF